MENGKSYIHFPFSIPQFQFISCVICLNRDQNSVVVVAAANKSTDRLCEEHGEQLIREKCGRIKNKRYQQENPCARAREKARFFASPSATNDCWNPVWNALVNPSAKYTRSAQTRVRSTSSSSEVNRCTTVCGNSCTAAQIEKREHERRREIQLHDALHAVGPCSLRRS